MAEMDEMVYLALHYLDGEGVMVMENELPISLLNFVTINGCD